MLKIYHVMRFPSSFSPPFDAPVPALAMPRTSSRLPNPGNGHSIGAKPKFHNAVCIKLMKITLLLVVLALSLTAGSLFADASYQAVSVPPANFVSTSTAMAKIDSPNQTIGYLPDVPIFTAPNTFVNGQQKSISFSITPVTATTGTFSYTLGGQTLSLPSVVLGNELVISTNSIGRGNECDLSLAQVQIGQTLLFFNSPLFSFGNTNDYRAFVFTGFNPTDTITGYGTVTINWLSQPSSGISSSISLGSVVPESSTTMLLGLVLGGISVASLIRRTRKGRTLVE